MDYQKDFEKTESIGSSDSAKGGMLIKFGECGTSHLKFNSIVLELFPDGVIKETHDLVAYGRNQFVGGYFQYIFYNSNGGQVWQLTHNLWQPSGPYNGHLVDTYPDMPPIFNDIFNAKLVLSTKWVV